MQIVPVIDLKNSEVVRARKGERDSYRPIVSPLSPSSRPLDVVGGLLTLFPFSTLYIADLDAITGAGDNIAVVGDLQKAFPRLELWVDRGFSDARAVATFLARPGVCAVIGTESQRDATMAGDLRDDARVLLSIDFLHGRYVGPAPLLGSPDLWPRRVIGMTLDRVGGAEGPCTELLADLVGRAGDRRVFAAGGVRGASDVAALRDLGVHGALVASALHDGRLTASELTRLSAA